MFQVSISVGDFKRDPLFYNSPKKNTFKNTHLFHQHSSFLEHLIHRSQHPVSQPEKSIRKHNN